MMKNGVTDIEEMRAMVHEVVARHGAMREELIPILSEVNGKFGYLPRQALQEVGQRLRLPASQVFSVASFYRMLSTRPRGRHVIQFCESAPCHVVGGREVWQAVQDELHLQPGDTSADSKWTLLTTSCLGVCAVGPVLVIDGEIYGNLEPEQIPAILAQFV